MIKKSPPKIKWSYGRDPNPKTWHETVEALNSLAAFDANKKHPEPPDRLDSIYKKNKEQKVRK